MKTIGIIGAGPAGIATAIRLKKLEYNVLLFDAGISKHITVGEHLSAETLHEMKVLGIDEELLKSYSIPCSEVQNAWGKSEIHHNESIFNPFGDSYILSRPDFDRSLLNHCEHKGIHVHYDTRIRKIADLDQGWNLFSDKKVFQVDFVVDATGRNSKFLLEENQSKKRQEKDLIGITKRLNASDNFKSTKSHLLVESTKNGWWYSVQLQSGELIATFMTDPGTLKRSGLNSEEFWSESLQYSLHTKQRVQDYELNSKTYVQSAHSQIASKIVGRLWAKVGDSAQSYDPLSSAGIIKGFKMGIACANAIASFHRGITSSLENYQNNVREQYKDYIIKRDEFYQQEKRWLNEPFWFQRSFNPKLLEKFSITPLLNLKVSSEQIEEKIRFLNKHIPEVDFHQLVKSISNHSLAKDAVQDYMSSQSNTQMNPWLLHSLESLKLMKVVETI